tara:strand:+ start:252 stop:392 length:141 start_codon:yes stop_codon:yes gene_type:complete
MEYLKMYERYLKFDSLESFADYYLISIKEAKEIIKIAQIIKKFEKK